MPYVAIALLVFATVYSAIVSFKQPVNHKHRWIFPDAATQSTRIFVGALTIALLTGFLWWLHVSAQNATHRSSRFLIPEGYTGWVRIEFEVQGAPPLPMEGGQYVLKIPSGGVLRTSSAEQYGWAKDHYYYYSAQEMHALPDCGPAELIWGKVNGEETEASGNRKYEEFFVGNSQQFTGGQVAPR
ncbi:MAG: hypothetical protein WA899_14445 [Candidatus Sulfotelmatobacter sp.]